MTRVSGVAVAVEGGVNDRVAVDSGVNECVAVGVVDALGVDVAGRGLGLGEADGQSRRGRRREGGRRVVIGASSQDGE